MVDEPDITKEIDKEATGSVAKKPILCLDFDGVIHDYKEGWKDGKIYGHVTPGFFEWAWNAKDIFELHIFSSRSVLQMREMYDWMVEEYHQATVPDAANPAFADFGFVFDRQKPPAFLTIDDRAITFQGSWMQLNPSVLRGFKTWTQK